MNKQLDSSRVVLLADAGDRTVNRQLDSSRVVLLVDGGEDAMQSLFRAIGLAGQLAALDTDAPVVDVPLADELRSLLPDIDVAAHFKRVFAELPSGWRAVLPQANCEHCRGTGGTRAGDRRRRVCACIVNVLRGTARSTSPKVPIVRTPPGMTRQQARVEARRIQKLERKASRSR